MDAAKILAALSFKVRDAETDDVLLTLADLNACLVTQRTEVIVTPVADGIRVRAVTSAEALAEQRAQQLKRSVA